MFQALIFLATRNWPVILLSPTSATLPIQSGPMSQTSIHTVWIHDRIRRYQGGDLSARDELIAKVCGRLEDLSRRMLRRYPIVKDHADTQDVFQGASIRLIRALEKVTPDSVRGFFNLTAELIRRELLDLARRFRRRAEVPLSPGDDDSTRPIVDPPDPLSDDGQVEDWARFHTEVERLPAEEREVVGLVFYHRWTQTEVAELFGVTERTIRRWWQGALLKLRTCLQGNPEIV